MSFDEPTLDQFRNLLIKNEGLELKPYRCPAGKLSIGVGRNLEDVGISTSEAMILLENDIKRVCLQLEKALPWTQKLSPARRIALSSMVFNMGLSKVLEFKNMMSALKVGDYSAASNEMLKSLWASQVKRRAVDLAVMMKTGQI